MSAVTPIPDVSPLLRNRRGAVRVPFGIQIMVSFKGSMLWTEADAALVEISASGMHVRCDRIPRSDQTVMIGFLWHGNGLCAAVGTPVRFEDGGGFGVSFTRINFTLRTLLEELEQVQEPMRGRIFDDLDDAQIWIE